MNTQQRTLVAGFVAAVLGLPLFFMGNSATVSGGGPSFVSSANARMGSGQADQQQADELERLRTEVARLTLENQRLQQELRDARLRIVDLEQRLAEVGSGAGGAIAGGGEGEGASDDADGLVIPEGGEHRLASPDVVLARLQEDYREATSDLSYDDERDKFRYMRALQAWAARADAKYRGRFEWAAVIVGMTPVTASDAVDLEIIVRDPQTGDRWSVPFEMSLTTSRLVERFRRFGLSEGDAVMIKGTFRTRINIDENREDVAQFQTVDLIGPFAEYHWEAEVQSVVPAPDRVIEAWREAEEQRDGEGGTATGGTAGGN